MNDSNFYCKIVKNNESSYLYSISVLSCNTLYLTPGAAVVLCIKQIMRKIQPIALVLRHLTFLNLPDYSELRGNNK